MQAAQAQDHVAPALAAGRAEIELADVARAARRARGTSARMPCARQPVEDAELLLAQALVARAGARRLPALQPRLAAISARGLARAHVGRAEHDLAAAARRGSAANQRAERLAPARTPERPTAARRRRGRRCRSARGPRPRPRRARRCRRSGHAGRSTRRAGQWCCHRARSLAAVRTRSRVQRARTWQPVGKRLSANLTPLSGRTGAARRPSRVTLAGWRHCRSLGVFRCAFSPARCSSPPPRRSPRTSWSASPLRSPAATPNWATTSATARSRTSRRSTTPAACRKAASSSSRWTTATTPSCPRKTRRSW